MRTLNVHVSESRISRVVLESGILHKVRHYLAPLVEGRNIALVTDTRVSALYGNHVRKSLDIPSSKLLVLDVPEGEKSKTFSSINALATALAEKQFERGDFIIALGGGVVLDLAGFLASVYMRGIPYITIPTTLLSQVDVCIGGKVAVNHAGGRNLLGQFYHPQMVLVDPDFLRSLDQRDLKSGLTEVVKAAIIGDKTLFQRCEKCLQHPLRPQVNDHEEMIIRALHVKKRIIEKDEKEKGPRMVLNLGHTVGHALETATDYKLLRHGESIAVGTLAAAVIARRRGLLSPGTFEKIANVITRLLPGGPWKTVPDTAILDAMKRDKKKQLDRVPFILPKQVGKVATVWDVDQKEIQDALDEVRRYGPEDI
ncbi:MAG: 3-dehydroquinate synthase [Deltaproteobacteria bacterium]|nr:3-dehydroquinate synthase [Deltaproteobacteria bacterium]